MMENPRLEEENLMKDIRNLFRLRKELLYKATRNLSRQEKETKAINDRILREIENLFEHEEEESYYKQVRVSNFSSNNYIDYENRSDRNKALSVEECLNKIRT